MAENLPVHMSDDEEEIVDNKSDLSELSNNEKEIQYESVSETSLDSDFDEEDDKFQAPLVVPQQPLIPSWQQPRLRPCLFCSGPDQMRRNIRPPTLPAIIPNINHQDVCTPKGQTAETEIESWELFFDNAMLESILQTSKLVSSQCDRDAIEMDVIEIYVLFGLPYVASTMCVSHMNIDDFYQTDGTGVEFFHLVMPKIWFQFLLRALRFDDLIMEILEMDDENCINWLQIGKYMKIFHKYS